MEGSVASEGWVERDGTRLHYVRWGLSEARGAPALLLLHGLSSNALVWQRMSPRLHGWRVVALDQRSHGLSDRPDSGYGAATLVEDAAHAIEALGLGRAVVAGHSWGAAIALELAATRPDLICGLGFVDGPATAMSALMTWDQAVQRMEPPLPVYPDLSAAAAAQADYLGSAWDDDLLGFVRAGLVDVPGGLASTLSAGVRHQILKALYHYQPELLFPQVEGPILLALASDPFPGAPPVLAEMRTRSAEGVRHLRPDTVIRWYDSRHDIPLIRPDELAIDLERLAYSAAWHDLARRARALSGDWSRPAQAEGGTWSARELLAHIASTQAAMAGVVAAEPRAEHGERPAFDPDRWNAGQLRRREAAGPADLLAEMTAGADALQGALFESDLARPAAIGRFAGRPLREVMEAMLEHQRRHLGELESVLAGTQSNVSA